MFYPSNSTSSIYFYPTLNKLRKTIYLFASYTGIMESAVKSQIISRFEKIKQKLNIIIFGSYEPTSELLRLKSLKEHLISQGYLLTKLVRDYSDDLVPPGITDKKAKVYIKSIQLCRESNYNFFVATHVGKGKGWVNELTYCCRDCPNGIGKTSVFDQLHDNESALGIVNLGMVKIHGMTREPFCSTDDLKKAGKRVAFNCLIRELDK